MRFHLLSLITCIFAFFSMQAQIGIGQWREHYPYYNTQFVQSSETYAYCATNRAVLVYNKTDNELSRLTTITGLSDVDISALTFDTHSKQLIIGYSNGNIDFVDEFNRVYNLPALKNSSIIGTKEIHQIYIYNNQTYVCCGIGIVVLNTVKREIKDTYLYGPQGAQVNTLSASIFNNALYALTTEGEIFSAPLSAPNLADYNAWSKDLLLPTATYSALFSFGGKLFVNSQTGNFWAADTLYEWNGNAWVQSTFLDGEKNFSFRVIKDKLMVSNRFAVRAFNQSFQVVADYYQFSGKQASPNDAVMDEKNDLWVADRNLGFARVWPDKNAQFLSPNGPMAMNNFSLSAKNGRVWMLPGAWTISLAGIFRVEGFHFFENNNWNSFLRTESPALDTVYDLVRMAVDPRNKQKVFIASWGRGIIEWEGNQEVNVYNETNSSLKPRPEYYWIGMGGLAFDKNNHLWMSNAHVNECLQLLTASGQWQSFNLSPYCNSLKAFNHLLIDQTNQKWLFSQRANEILVVNDNGTIDNTADDKVVLLNKSNGNMPAGEEIYAAALDKDGKIWVGTDQGVYVFFSPGSVQNGGSNAQAQQIYITQDGIVQLLLETEAVTAIAVDGANRKWFGTSNSGVYLMSESGTELIAHFTRENSPLPSNTIIDIAVEDVSGEVFFSTDKGLIAYMGTATEAKQDCKDLVAFPNPVRHDYTGPIAIRGLIGNSEVKITDTAGNLVYKTTSFGGQAVWDGNNIDGNRVQSGVYIAHCAAPDGKKSCPVKILIAGSKP